MERLGPITGDCFQIVSRVESSRDETEESDTIYKQQFLPIVRTPVAHRGLNECLSLTILNLGWSPFTKINWKRRVDCKEKKDAGEQFCGRRQLVLRNWGYNNNSIYYPLIGFFEYGYMRTHFLTFFHFFQ